MMHKMFNIKDVSGKCGQAVRHAGDFLPYAQQKLGFNKPVGVNFVSDMKNAKDPFGKTAYYDPNKMEITVYVDKRHVKDILRSLSHELVHHTQNCRGEFDREHETGPGYAQRDPHMRKMEAEAYLLGNGFLFRDYEDQLKEKQEMSRINEGAKPDYIDIDGDGDKEESMKKAARDKKNKEKQQENLDEIGKPEPDEEDDKGDDKKEEKPKKRKSGATIDKPGDMTVGLEESNEISENWTKGNKDQLLFERLIKKWAK